MIHSTPPAASEQANKCFTDNSKSASYTESPLDKALAALKASNSHRPIPTTDDKADVNDGCTSFVKRCASIPPPVYRPSFTYLGEANPEIYVNPVAVNSLRFVGAPLPWAEDRSAAQMQQGKEDEESKERKAKAATSVKSRAKGKAKPAEVTKKTPISAVPKAPAQASPRQTRSMSKAKTPGGATRSISTSSTKKNTSYSDSVDARPEKRARLSVPQDTVTREAPQHESEEHEQEKETGNLVLRLPPLSVVRNHSGATVVDENEAKALGADKKSEHHSDDIRLWWELTGYPYQVRWRAMLVPRR